MSCSAPAGWTRPLLLLGLLAGCGDPLVGPEFLGQPLLEVGGSVVQLGGRIPVMHGPLSLSLFWVGTGATGPQRVEQSAALDSGLASFGMTVFDAPPAAATTLGPLRGDERRLGLALIALYADRDANGRLDPGADLVLGASARHLIGWADAPLPPGSSAALLLGALGEGYQLFEHQLDGGSTQCPLAAADTCAGEGRLLAVPDDSTIVLTLWDDPGLVVVPAPALQGTTTSIWAR